MKKIMSIMLVVALMLLAVMPTVFGADNTVSEYSFFINIYNDMDNTYPVSNKEITISSKTTVLETLNLLKEKKFITGYTVNENKLTSISFDNKKIVAESSSTKTAIFYTKLNGEKQAIDEVNHVIENGDIIEWIYGNVSDDVAVPETKQKTAEAKTRPQTTHWTDSIQNSMSNACEFLTLNQETSNFYIVALGCAGKSADVKMVNSLLSEIRQTEIYKAPTDIAKNILSLTFCGYDASELVSQLSIYPDITKQGVLGAVNSLIAYDSKQYAIIEDQVNSRDKLIHIITSSQRNTGGFGINKDAKDDLDTTAMAITALSPYIDRPNVKSVIDKAIEFLLENQTKTGGFGFMGQESSESLSQVIIALSSVGIEVDDARFMNRKKNLLDQLLEYKNDDGGFSHIKGEISGAMPTEQAIIALSSIKQNDNPYKMTRTLSLPPQTKAETIVDAVKEYPLITFAFITLVIIIVLIVVLSSVFKNKKKNQNR